MPLRRMDTLVRPGASPPRTTNVTHAGSWERRSLKTIRAWIGGLGADVLATIHATHVAPAANHSFAAQLAGLLHPSGELSFVELVVLVVVEVAHFLLLGLA